MTAAEGDDGRGSKPGDKGAVFLVDEGRAKKSLWTNFVGNTIASDARLMTQIKSKPGIFWLIGGDIDRDKLDAGRRPDHGLLPEPRILPGEGRPSNSRWCTGRRTRLDALTFVDQRGPRYQRPQHLVHRKQQVRGEFLARDLKLKSGEPFNQSKMDSDLGLIRDIYGGRGFIFADMPRANSRFLEQPGELDLVYNVAEGQALPGREDANIRIRGGEHPHAAQHDPQQLLVPAGDILDIRKLPARTNGGSNRAACSRPTPPRGMDRGSCSSEAR
jgi:outer membrane protein insertion porin family